MVFFLNPSSRDSTQLFTFSFTQTRDSGGFSEAAGRFGEARGGGGGEGEGRRERMKERVK